LHQSSIGVADPREDETAYVFSRREY